MIQIKKDNTILQVTKGAYRNFYQALGYRIVRGSQMPEISGGVNTHGDEENQHLEDSTQPEMAEAEYEDEELDLSEIPLTQMSVDQLCAYADQLGLDREGIRSKKELRALIRDHLE